MPAIFNNVACDIPVSEPRNAHNTPDKRKPNLAAVRVPGQQQRNALRKLWKDVRIVRERNQRHPGRYIRYRVADSLGTRPLFSQPNEPERRAARVELSNFVL